MFVTRKAVFLENEFIFKKSSGSKVELQEIQEPQTLVQDSMGMDKDLKEVVEPKPITQESRRSDRIYHEAERFRFLITND